MPIAPFSRRITTLAIAAGLAFGAAACSSDSGSDAAPTTAAPTTTAAVPETTEAPTTEPAPPAPTGRPDAREAAAALYDAWVAGDRPTALTVAEPAAVDAIWAATPGPYQLYSGCDTGEFDTGGCLFRDRTTNNTIQIDLERRDTGWVVVVAFFSPG